MTDDRFDVVLSVQMQAEQSIAEAADAIEMDLSDGYDVLEAQVTAIAKAGEDRD